MALPPDTRAFAQIMDPQEILDYAIPLSPLLEEGEGVDAFTVTPFAESLAAGLIVLGIADGYPDPEIVFEEGEPMIQLWFTISALHENDVAFDSLTELPLQLNFTTDNNPPRERDRAMILQVRQRGD